MMAGGDAVDYDVLTATAGDVPEGLKFLGAGSEDEQTGTLPNRVNMHGSPGYSEDEPTVPVHPAETAAVTKNTNNEVQIVIAPPKGKYPGGSGVYVGCKPAAVGVTADVVANGKTAAGVTGSYGSDGNLVAADLRAGKVAYGAAGRVAGDAADYGKVSKTIAAGDSYDIKEGFYGAGKITAKDLASQTGANLADDMARENYTFWRDGVKHTGSLKYRGTAQYGGFGAGTDYYAINGLPEGIYRNEGAGSWAPEGRVAKSTVRSALGIDAAKISKGQSIAEVTGTAPRSANVNWATTISQNCTGYSSTAGNRAVSIGAPYADWDTVVMRIYPQTEYNGPLTIALSKGKSQRVPLTTLKYSDSIYQNAWTSVSRSSSGEIKFSPFRGNVSGTYNVRVEILAVFDGSVLGDE